MAEIDDKLTEIEQKKAQNKRITKQVKKFMKSVKEYVKSKNGGKIDPSWSCSLDMLEQYYTTYLKLSYEIAELPSLVIDTRYGAAPTPLLKARDSTAVRLSDLLKGFGLTMKSAMSMEIIEPVAEESVLEKFVKNKTIEKR